MSKKHTQSAPVASAEEAQKEEKKGKDITHVIGEPPVPEKVKPDSEKVMRMKTTVDHDGIEYKAGARVPEKFIEMFSDLGFAELV